MSDSESDAVPVELAQWQLRILKHMVNSQSSQGLGTSSSDEAEEEEDEGEDGDAHGDEELDEDVGGCVEVRAALLNMCACILRSPGRVKPFHLLGAG
jgi:hypothetical protein